MKILTLDPIYPGTFMKLDQVIDAGITPEGVLYWLEIHYTTDQRKEKEGDICKKTGYYRPAGYSINTFHHNKKIKITIPDKGMDYHFILPFDFPDVWIAADRRSFYIKEQQTGEKNIHIIDKSGTMIKAFCFGDGITKIMKLGNEIWTAYFDEGIYGNCGWDNPVGRSGLTAWDEEGTMIFEFPGNNCDPGVIEPVDDCYAMNSDGHNIYIHYYSGFPLVQIDKHKRVRSYTFDIAGADFAVYKNFFLFRKAYSKEPLLYLYKKNNNKFALLEKIQINFKGSTNTNFTTFTNREYMLVRNNMGIFIINVKKIIE